MIHIGFTGTRRGMRGPQGRAVLELVLTTLRDYDGDQVALRFHGRRVVAHHGDCLGADAEFHRLAQMCAWQTHGHPPSSDACRAFCDFDESELPLPYLVRNERIVAASTLMLATPGESIEQQRGGTWATIRMARRAGKPLVIVYPDGSREGEWTL